MCTSIAIGKKATTDAVTLIARNEDCANNGWNKYMVYRKNPEYYPVNNNNVINKNQWILGNGLSVDIPKKHYSYSATPDSIAYKEVNNITKSKYYFEERGINECNVAISATNSLSAKASEPKKNSDGTINTRYDNKCKRMQRLEKFCKIGIEESIIPTLILPQINSAKEGVKLLGKYVETKRASEGNGILFSDVDEVWYMEIGSKSHWIAVKIPADSYIVVANGMRIHGVDLNSKNVLHSKGLFEFVLRNNFLKRPNKQCFNFAQAFGILGNPYNDDRIWLAQSILTSSKKQQAPKIQDEQKVKGVQTKEQYPLFLQPDKKVKVKDVMSILRSNYDGTVLECTGKRPIGVFYTGESHIITFDKKMPKLLRGMIWQTISTPLGAPYMPIYNVVDQIPSFYSIGNNQYDSQSAFWAFRGLFALGEYNKNCEQNVQKYWYEYEDQFIIEQNRINNTIKSIFNSENIAIDLVQNFSTSVLYETVANAMKKKDSLMTEIINNQ